jgi:hypothetical protein
MNTLSNEIVIWYSKKEICEVCNVDEKTFRRFKKESNLDSTVQVKRNLRKGDRNVDYYPETILKQFQMWLKRNAMNAGGQRTEGSIVKQDNQQDLFIGCVATKGTPDEIRSLAEHLKVMADQKEQLEIANNTNKQLQLENKQLVEENDYLKKANDFTTAQLGYYKRKYHSYYDDYEIY